MNIREHIEANHYPTDDKGRALVPMRNGSVVAVCSAAGSEVYPIVGVRPCRETPSGWTADGSWERHQFCKNDLDLLPPPPRKVKVTGWASFLPPHAGKDGALGAVVLWNREPTPDDQARWTKDGVRVVELTGEYEEPWT